MNRKKKSTWLLTAIFCMVLTFSSYAGWKTGAEPNQNRWWYDYEDGRFASFGWYWLDGNGDGIAESYFFDADGWMAADTVTPDGYTVNHNGAWVVDGTVMTKTLTEESGQQQTAKTSLVVYFSRTNTTERAAARISELTGASMVKIEAEEPYSGSYQETLSRARQELNSNARPGVLTAVENIEQYDTIYVGFPIWYGTMPRPVLTFLEKYDLSGKTIVPFCTSGSSGIEQSVRELQNAFPEANVTAGRRVNQIDGIEAWLSGLGLLG